MNEQGMDNVIEREKTLERVRTLGPLEAFGLGNEHGIPSSLANATESEQREHDQELINSITEITDKTCDCCIDGRHKNGNADGSRPKVRAQFVGGSAANLGVAMNAGSSILDAIPQNASISEMVSVVDEHIARTSGKNRAAHLGGCGGANGELADDEAIVNNPNILNTAKALLADPEIREFFQLEDEAVEFEDVNFVNVSQRAAKTAEVLALAGWDGKKYVDGVLQDEPGNVEDLATDDSEHHGHKENSVVIYIGDENKTVSKGDEFVVNGNAIKAKAKSLAMQRGTVGYAEAVIAGVAKHLSAGNRLASKKTPVKIVK